MQTYKCTLCIVGNPNFVCEVDAATRQQAIIKATIKAKAKHGRDVNIARAHAELIEGK